MPADFRRVQDLALLLVRWGLLGALAYVTVSVETVPSPVPILVPAVLGLYALVLTVLFVGGWRGTRGFAYVQSAGDLLLVAGAMLLAPTLTRPAYAALLGVAVVIGLRRFLWPHALGYAVAAGAVGALAM